MNIGIIGLGFMGGSLAKSLSKLEKVDNIIAYDLDLNSLKKAKDDGVITNYANYIGDDFSDLDIIFLCTPVKFIKHYAERLEKIVKKDCIITDIGSTKKEVLNDVENLNITFIGGHPMIGSERSGYETSIDYLFENSFYILTPKNNKQPINILKDLIIEIGAIPVILEQEKHDYITAVISHVPHIIASALVNLVKNLDDKDETMKMLAAGGFKDITRIASSDPIMWEHICTTNKDEIIQILNIFINNLQSFKDTLNKSDKDNIINYFSSAKIYRDSFITKKINGQILPYLNVKIRDESGSIAKTISLIADHNISIKNIGIVNNREQNDGVLNIVFATYEDMNKGFDILKENNYDITKSE